MTSSYDDNFGAGDTSGTHAPESRPGEPVAIANSVNALIAALVGVGWFNIDSAVTNWIITVIGLAITVLTTLKARSKVTPVA